jgi:hypothetical protein
MPDDILKRYESKELEELLNKEIEQSLPHEASQIYHGISDVENNNTGADTTKSMHDDILKRYEIDQPLTESETNFVKSKRIWLKIFFGLSFKQDDEGKYYLDSKLAKKSYFRTTLFYAFLWVISAPAIWRHYLHNILAHASWGHYFHNILGYSEQAKLASWQRHLHKMEGYSELMLRLSLLLFQNSYSHVEVIDVVAHAQENIGNYREALLLYQQNHRLYCQMGRILGAKAKQSDRNTPTNLLNEGYYNALKNLIDQARCFCQFEESVEKALFLYKQVLEAYELFSPLEKKEFRDKLECIEHQAICLFKRRDFYGALLLFEELHKAYSSLDKNYQREMLLTRVFYNLNLGHLEEAKSKIQELFILEPWSLNVRHAKQVIAFIDESTKKYRNVQDSLTLKYVKSNYESVSLIFGEQHPETLLALDGLINIQLHMEPDEKKNLSLLRAKCDLILRLILTQGEYHDYTVKTILNLAVYKMKRGYELEAIELIKETANLLMATPMRYIGSFDTAVIIATVIRDLLKQNMTLNNHIDWSDLFHSLSHMLVEAVDLQPEGFLQKARWHLSEFYAAYLQMCLQHGREDIIPVILFAIQGRKIAAWILNELETPVAGEVKDAEVKRFLELRTELRQMAFASQQLVTGSREIESSNQQQFAEYQAKLDEYHSLRTELAQREDFQVINPQTFSVNLNTLQAKLLQTEAILLLIDFKAPYEENNRMGIAIIITQETQCRVDLKGLPQLSTLTRNCKTWHEETRSGMRLALSREDQKQKCKSEEIITERQLQEKIENDLWKPLYKHLEGIEHLHIVTHGDLHIIPYELGGAPPWVASFSNYPGLVFYYKLRHLRSEQNLINEI